VHRKFLEVERELNSILFEREEAIRGAIVALLSKQNVFFLGPPGTAKSLLCDQLCDRIAGANIFKWLLTKHTEPNEIFGPYSARQLVEHDVYRRVTAGRLPEAHFFFADEIWKSNSAVLNSLLKAINERVHEDAGTWVPIPLMNVFAASNEVPTDRNECAAIWDRFLMTFWVPEVQEHDNFCRMLLNRGAKPPPAKTKLTFQEIEAAQDAVAKVRFTPEVIELTARIREELERDKDKGVSASSRRWSQAMCAVAAMAFLAGRTEVEPSDLEVLVHCLWRVPGERRLVTDKVLAFCFPALQKALETLDLAAEQFKICSSAGVAGAERFEAYEKLKKLGDEASALRLRDNNPRIINVCEKILDMRKRGSRAVIGG
jgi:MoxR-like ATPase